MPFPVSVDDPSGQFVGYWTMLLGHSINIQPGGLLQLVVKITTTGAPVFGYHSETGNTCGVPASARFYISQGTGNDLERWWSNQVALTLQNTATPVIPYSQSSGVFNNTDGTVTMIVLFDPALWSSVYGEFANQDANTLAKFQQSLQNVGNIGVTFGGGCFFGHGANVIQGTGTATIELRQFRVGN